MSDELDLFCDGRADGHCPQQAGQTPCPADLVFNRLRVDYRVIGGARVSWSHPPSFTDPGPLSYQLQCSRAGTPGADDWEDIGVPVIDGFYAIDPFQRLWGLSNQLYYRVVGESLSDTYYSSIVPATASFDRRSLIHIQRVQRRLIRQFQSGRAPRGYLLKRRYWGAPCQTCLEPQTGDVTRTDCPECYGTRITGGYYPPVGCIYAQFAPSTRHERVDPTRGTANDQVVAAIMLNDPVIDSDDVWVDADRDLRYLVQEISTEIAVQGWPVVIRPRLYQLPASHPLYRLAIPEMDAIRSGIVP